MRVVHIIDTLKGGGAESSVCDLLPHLHAMGLTMSVIAGSASRLDETEKSRLKAAVIEGGKRGKLDASYCFRLTRVIRALRPDIVHTHTFHGKYWGRLCAIAAGVPTIVHTEHSSVERMPAYELFLTKLLVRRTRAYVTFSDRTRTLVESREPVPEIVVIPNGIEIRPAPTAAERAEARAALEAAPNELQVGMIASLLPNKNHALAIDGLARLSPSLRERVRLHVFGGGPLQSRLQQHAQSAGVGRNVRFHGFRPDIRRLLPALDLVLNLSQSEAAPISLLEAMNAGVPVVGTPNIGVMDVVEPERAGVILPDYTPAALAAALERVLRDPQWRASAGAHCRSTVAERHDLSRVAGRYVALYQRLQAV